MKRWAKINIPDVNRPAYVNSELGRIRTYLGKPCVGEVVPSWNVD